MEANNGNGRSGSTNSPIPKFSPPVSFQSQLFEGKLCYLMTILHSHTPPLHTGNPESIAPRQSPSSPEECCMATVFTHSSDKEICSVALPLGENLWKQPV